YAGPRGQQPAHSWPFRESTRHNPGPGTMALMPGPALASLLRERGSCRRRVIAGHWGLARAHAADDDGEIFAPGRQPNESGRRRYRPTDSGRDEAQEGEG